ncbi:RNA polymerase sigma factor [candidate division KSB1 bacterium]|nr:RNA polymerase sigma factor [candidate division KSB1 bacterium]
MNRYKNQIYTQAYYFTGSKQDSEDIVQEVFLRLWNHADRVDKKAVYGWLCRVTRNLCIDSYRKKKETLLDAECDDDYGSYLLENVQDSSPTPEQYVIYEDFQENILREISKLPEKIRTILIMRDIQDCPYELIAETLSLPVNTIKVYLHRGRRTLAQRINFLKKAYQTE